MGQCHLLQTTMQGQAPQRPQANYRKPFSRIPHNVTNKTTADSTGVDNAQAELLINQYAQDGQHQDVNPDPSIFNSYNATPNITAATGQLREATQQASRQRNQQPADRIGVTNAQAALLTNIPGHDEQHQDPTDIFLNLPQR